MMMVLLLCVLCCLFRADYCMLLLLLLMGFACCGCYYCWPCVHICVVCMACRVCETEVMRRRRRRSKLEIVCLGQKEQDLLRRGGRFIDPPPKDEALRSWEKGQREGVIATQNRVCRAPNTMRPCHVCVWARTR